MSKVTSFAMLCAHIVSLPNDSLRLSFPKLSSSPASPSTFLFSVLLHLHFLSLPFLFLKTLFLLPPPLAFQSQSLRRAFSSSCRLVSQDAFFQAVPLGPTSMGGDWVGRDITDWTLPLRTGALAGHPPSASDGRGR